MEFAIVLIGLLTLIMMIREEAHLRVIREGVCRMADNQAQ